MFIVMDDLENARVYVCLCEQKMMINDFVKLNINITT